MIDRTSIEKIIKSQFEKKYKCSDWELFKLLAESNFKEAVELKKRNMLIRENLKLLARNSRKRLLIGIGMELLLKSVYLKQGYLINLPKPKSALRFPFKDGEEIGIELQKDRTYQLNDLIQNISKVVKLKKIKAVQKGLRIAKVFRNKEGHGVTLTHSYCAENYTDIATSLKAIYQEVFEQDLEIQFSMETNQKAIWKLT